VRKEEELRKRRTLKKKKRLIMIDHQLRKDEDKKLKDTYLDLCVLSFKVRRT
jgi:hypothetical protein